MSNDDYGSDITRALREDAYNRECMRIYAPTPREQREQEQRAITEAFEHGDHQPDGTVLPPMEGMKYERTPTGCWLGKPVQQADKIDTAMGQMEGYLAKRLRERAMRARGCNNGIVATYPQAVTDCDGSEEERLSVQDSTAEDERNLRKNIERALRNFDIGRAEFQPVRVLRPAYGVDASDGSQKE